MATLALTDVQQCPLALSAADAKGNPATLPPGAVTWASSAPSVVAITPTADGMTANLVAAGALGTAQISVSVVVDPAQPPLTGTLDVTVGGSAAATIVITPGTPVAQ
jgi:hypothetical protein